jgi:hypothetical protein
MRTITDHIVAGDSANHQLTVEVTDEPGQGGACHRYEVTGFHINSNPSKPHMPGYPESLSRLVVLFQNGPIKEFGVNGLTQEVLLAIVMDRLKSFQAGPFACNANALAFGHCEEALRQLQQRTRERIGRAASRVRTKHSL